MREPYTLQFSDRALASLKRLDKTVAQRMLSKLEWLAANAAVITHVPLTGDWGGFYRLRVGDYRVIYRLDRDNCLIMVEIIGHRREVYDE
ncbi:MAG: type II toxin-antitoxin system RelE/ParE family toxin [Anaerolineae bacterium]|nr:type II toxin-antitoxin system RelE/ParE family toxin [Anaerolineae bacterium]